MSAIELFSTTEKNQGFFKLPPDKQATNKYLQKKEAEKSFSSRILEKVFSNEIKKSENMKDKNT